MGTVATLPGVLSVTPVYRPIEHAGAVQTQGDAVLHTDDLRDSLQFPPTGNDGTGVRVGVLSDSADRIGGGLKSSQGTGDLPEDVHVIWDGLYGGWGDTDEGRAMLEIVHDVAPGSSLYFTTASGGELAFSRGIRELAEAGCDIVVDDVAYYAERLFQDGIVAQAVEDVTKQWGVTYVSAAGNQANVSYESAFVDSNGAGPGTGYHDFDSGPGVDVFQQLRLPSVTSGERRAYTLVLQWDQPFYTSSGVTSNFDIYLSADDGTTVLRSATTNNPTTWQHNSRSKCCDGINFPIPIRPRSWQSGWLTAVPRRT